MQSYNSSPTVRKSWRSGLLRIYLLLASTGLLAVLAGCHDIHAADPPSSATGDETGARLTRVGSGQGLELDPAGASLAGVTTTVAGAQDLLQAIQPAGEVAATDSGTVQVTSRLPGRIAQVFATTGMKVKRGQVLATVDSVDLTQAEASYQTALQHLRLTRNQLEQQRRLAGYGSLSEPAVEDAQRAFAAAQAAVNSDRAQIDLDKLTLSNTQQLVNLGEITRKPVDDAQNAYAQTQAASVQARVNLHSTKANLDRAKLLFQSGVFSKQQLEDAETAYSNAEAATQQTSTAEGLAKDELSRQQTIYKQNLNGASSLQAAQSKVQQDQHQYQNDLTSLGLARVALRRAQAVRKSGIPVNQALQQAQDAFDEANVALQGSGNTLKLYGLAPGAGVLQLANGHAVIPVMAPLDGIVASRSMVVGQITDTATPLAKIVNLGQVYVNAQVYEQDVTDVVPGSPVALHVPAYPGRTFQGRVVDIGREVSPDTRTLTVRTLVANPNWLLRPGMYATIRMTVRQGASRLAIPEQAVFQEGNGQAVYLQVGDRLFVKRSIRVGPASQGRVPILSGISPGDKVVVAGNLFLESEQEKLESRKRGAA